MSFFQNSYLKFLHFPRPPINNGSGFSIHDESKMISRKQNLRVLPILLLIISVLAVPTLNRTSSSAATVSTSGIHNVLLYSVVGLISPTPSYITVNELALNLFSKPLPSQLTLSLASSYNGGAPDPALSCTVAPQGSILSNCSFHIPFKGWGVYLLIGSVYGSNGTLLAQTGIDPVIEPEWK